MVLRRVVILAILTLPMAAVLAPVVVGAAVPTIVPARCQGANAATDCGICELAQLVTNLLNFAIYGAVVAAAVLFAWTGFKFLTSRDNSGALTAAKKMFWNVILGLIIVLAAWLIVNTIVSFMVGSGNPFTWNKLCNSIRTGDGYTYAQLIPKA